MKCRCKWLVVAALAAMLLQTVALAGTFEAEPMDARGQGEWVTDAIPPIEPEATIEPTSWSMPTTFRATRGGTYQLVQVSPWDRTLPTIYAQSSKPDIVSVNDRGEITAKEYGKATITVKGADGKKIKCGVEVVPNSMERKAAKGAPGEVSTSTKRLYYKDGKLMIEIYLLNRTGSTITGASGLKMQILRGGDVLYERAIPDWTSAKGFRHGQQKVYKASIDRDEHGTFADGKLDLGSGEYEAVVVGWEGAISVGAPGSAALEPVTDIEPPEPAESAELALTEPID